MAIDGCGKPVTISGDMAIEHVATPACKILKVAEDVLPVARPTPLSKPDRLLRTAGQPRGQPPGLLRYKDGDDDNTVSPRTTIVGPY